MTAWKTRLLKGSTALAAAAWLLMTPHAALAQWWEDESAYEEGSSEGLFTENEYYDDYSYNDGEVAGTGELPYGDEEVAIGEREGIGTGLGYAGEGEGEEREYGGYYDEEFEENEWGDWF